MRQNYANHMHHPVPTYIASAASLGALGVVATGWTNTLQDVGLLLLIVNAITLGAISRLYTTTLQDRIIRLEMQVRAAQVLSRPQQALLARLGPKQVAALRFAGDDELGALVERASAEALTTKAIKQSITNWQPDTLRT